MTLALATVLAVAVGAHAQTRKDIMAQKRESMVAGQIERRGISDPRVLAAMRSVPRHEFVPRAAAGQAYGDHPLPIGQGQTISQPYIVALMTELLETEPGDHVLEIGTGSGYQAAVLADLVEVVYSIEIVEELGESARDRLSDLGYDNVEVRVGDGYQGWPEHAPFDGIIVTAAPPEIPQRLVEQLADGGHMVLPVGTDYQQLMVVTRRGDKIDKRTVTAVRFVPMVHGDQPRNE